MKPLLLPLLLAPLLVSCGTTRTARNLPRQQPTVEPSMREATSTRMQPAAIDELPELESRPQVLDYALLVWDKIPPVYFAPGSSVIPDEARASLRAAISLLGKSRQPVVLAGHTGNLGSSEYNRALGELRAQRVKQALVQGGIPGETISTVSFGPDKPASQGSDDRVEFGIPGPDMAVR